MASCYQLVSFRLGGRMAAAPWSQVSARGQVALVLSGCFILGLLLRASRVWAAWSLSWESAVRMASLRCGFRISSASLAGCPAISSCDLVHCTRITDAGPEQKEVVFPPNSSRWRGALGCVRESINDARRRRSQGWFPVSLRRRRSQGWFPQPALGVVPEPE